MTDDSAAPRGRRSFWVGVAIVAFATALRGWVGLRGYLSQDDFAFEYRAATLPLGGHHYLLDAWNGHLMPGSFLMVWFATHVAPLSVWPPVVMDLAVQAATDVMLLVLLRELFGRRKAVLVPLTLFVLSPVTLTGFAWWAAALNQLPAMLAMVTTLYLHVRYLRTGALRTGAYAIAAFVVGLAFFEKLLLFAPVLLLFTIMYAVPGTWVQRTVGAVRLHWRLWVLWTVVLLPYVVYYETAVTSTVTGTSPTNFLDIVDSSWHGLRGTVLGGPWKWDSLGDATNSIPAIGGALSVLSWIVVIAVVGAGTAVFRQSSRAWLLPAIYFFATAGLLAAGRGQIGPVIGLAYRYYAEVALLAAIALPLSLLPLVGTVARGELTVLEQRSWVPALRSRLHRADEPPWTMSQNSRLVTVRGLVLALVLSSTLSTVQYDKSWHGNPGAAFIKTARSELGQQRVGLVLADTAVPIGMMSLLFFPYNTVSHVLRPLPEYPSFLTVGTSSSDLHVLDDSGHVHPVAIDGQANLPGPRADCGWFATADSGAIIPLAVPLFDFDWTLRIGYIASQDTRAVITAGRTSVRVQLKAGLHAVFVRVIGPVGSVRIDGLAADASLCTDDVKVGNVRVKP